MAAVDWRALSRLRLQSAEGARTSRSKIIVANWKSFSPTGPHSNELAFIELPLHSFAFHVQIHGGIIASSGRATLGDGCTKG